MARRRGGGSDLPEDYQAGYMNGRHTMFNVVQHLLLSSALAVNVMDLGFDEHSLGMLRRNQIVTLNGLLLHHIQHHLMSIPSIKEVLYGRIRNRLIELYGLDLELLWAPSEISS